MKSSQTRRKQTQTPPPPRPKQTQTPPPPRPKQAQEQPKLTRTIQDSLISGFGFGIGNSISHNLINGIFSTKQTSQSSQPSQIDSRNCNNLITELDTCILLNKDCSDLYTKLNLHKCQYEQYECKKPKIFFNEHT